MSETRKRFEDESTDRIAAFLREFARMTHVTNEWRTDMLNAAANRLVALQSSAGVLSESDAVRRERELVMRQREAYVMGCCDSYPKEDARRVAAVVYPLQPRPRVRTCNGSSWRVVNHRLEELPLGSNQPTAWRQVIATHPSCELVPVWADLFANPMEDVDAESPDAR